MRMIMLMAKSRMVLYLKGNSIARALKKKFVIIPAPFRNATSKMPMGTISRFLAIKYRYYIANPIWHVPNNAKRYIISVVASAPGTKSKWAIVPAPPSGAKKWIDPVTRSTIATMSKKIHANFGME